MNHTTEKNLIGVLLAAASAVLAVLIDSLMKNDKEER